MEITASIVLSNGLRIVYDKKTDCNFLEKNGKYFPLSAEEVIRLTR